MEHDEALEQLELAAVEPDGLARLMAGDTPLAAAVAGHLAGCESCTEEFRRLGRAAPLLRDVVRTTPPADLRARTLAYVRALGDQRGAVAGPAIVVGPAMVAERPSERPATRDTPPAPAAAPTRPRAIRLLPWVASLAAAIALAVLGTSFLADRQLADQYRAVGGLEAVTTATIEITAQPDAERVTLGASDGGRSGSLLFSPSTKRLVVVATGLERPPAGQEYRCWVELAGKRENVGRMFFADELAYWVGDTPAISDVPPGTTFGVSLTDLEGTRLDARPVIAGQL